MSSVTIFSLFFGCQLSFYHSHLFYHIAASSTIIDDVTYHAAIYI